MRQIKVRGKNAKGEWVYGSLVQESCGDVWIFPEGDTYCNAGGDFYSNKYPGICIVKPETVGQFTGLKDKNGKEIYEGDKLKVDGKGTFRIAHQSSCICGYVLLYMNGDFADYLKGSLNEMYEVVGNIY